MVLMALPALFLCFCSQPSELACLAGLWLNIPDYDAPTQMVKPKERNERYVDAVLTIPKVGAHFEALPLLADVNLQAAYHVRK